MKKWAKFWHTVPLKLYLAIAAAILFSFFSNDFGLVDIQKTAIMLAVGIDRTEGGYALTAQIAVPKGTDRTTGGTSSLEITGEGETVSDCVGQIYGKTGWVPKLVFCDLILIGEETARENVFSVLDYFLRHEYMPESCFVAVCEGSARDMLSTGSAADDASSLALKQLFSDAAQKSGKVVRNTLKDFAVDYYGVSKSGYAPFVRALPQDGAQDTSGGATGKDGAQGETQRVYTSQETALFCEGRMCALLAPEETLAFSLLKGNVYSGTVTVEDGEEEGAYVTLTVLKNRGKVAFSLREGAPHARLTVELNVRLYDRSTASSIEDIAKSMLTPAIERAAEKQLSGAIGSLWEKGKTSGCDLFYFARALYRSSPSDYRAQREGLLGRTEVEIRAVVDGIR